MPQGCWLRQAIASALPSPLPRPRLCPALAAAPRCLPSAVRLGLPARRQSSERVSAQSQARARVCERGPSHAPSGPRCTQLVEHIDRYYDALGNGEKNREGVYLMLVRRHASSLRKLFMRHWVGKAADTDTMFQMVSSLASGAWHSALTACLHGLPSCRAPPEAWRPPRTTRAAHSLSDSLPFASLTFLTLHHLHSHHTTHPHPLPTGLRDRCQAPLCQGLHRPRPGAHFVRDGPPQLLDC